jgi:serine/threonine-protein kinase
LRADLPPALFVESRAFSLPPVAGGHRSARRARPEPLYPPGKIIDKYRLLEVVGTGGFAVVYRAKHLLLDRIVALKLLKAELLAEHRGAGALLVEEARLAARITHPNVVRVLDVTHTEDLSYIVMDFVEGVSLARRLATSGALSPSQVLRLGLDVAAGLRAGHEQGLIHRDIKPGNVLLTSEGSARIVDYGMARATSRRDWLWQTGKRAVVGTRGYMAPEQLGGHDVDFRADVYALGITLEEALRGTRDSVSRGLLRSSIPKPFVELLDFMQAPAATERPESYDALLAALERVASELGRGARVRQG